MEQLPENEGPTVEEADALNIGGASQLTKSSTSSSLAEPLAPAIKDPSASMASSGYESQAVSSSTLSSEDSLSLAEEPCLPGAPAGDLHTPVVPRLGKRVGRAQDRL